MFSLKQVSDLSIELKSIAPAVIVITSCISGWAKECSDNAKLEAEVIHLKSLNKINENIKELRTLVANIKPPTLQEVKDENAKLNNAAIDSDSDTF